MADIFLSYATEDRETAAAVAGRFEALGFSVWWDRKIPAGMTWRQVIESALNDMGCMVVLWSGSSLASTWVSEEAEEARMRGKLVPALIEAVLPPLGFRGIQAADLIDWDGSGEAAGFRHLLAGVEGFLPGRSAAGRPVVPAADTRVSAGRRRGRWMAGAGACLLLVLTAGTWFWYGQHEPPAASATRSDGVQGPAAAAPTAAGKPSLATAATRSQPGEGGVASTSAPKPEQPGPVASTSTAGRGSPEDAAPAASTTPARDGKAATTASVRPGATAATGNEANPGLDPPPPRPRETTILTSAPASAGRPARPAAEPGARPARAGRCTDLLERQSLGDALSADERAYFQKECRR
ncbi:MAG: hypothetical protein AW08_01982 [Candidatus Accumulibacter adjunctus]|uniref:TIR domain-containing protein n=1 Tax=Candidatus Accumulibacter adjunctus TaxID=1454001 RepID=A0A011MXY3_9PROT|nr:MAG: hypothetical protein AW08_01982 [Candidatus Accumulibacter adjunctus]